MGCGDGRGKVSRPKSPERIQLEADRAIRKERREVRRKLREARRAAREHKRIVRAGIAEHGIPKVESSGEHFGIRDAIALNPWTWCEGGHPTKEKELMGVLCAACYFEFDGRNPIRRET
jgi:hypothetical protein